MKNIYKCKIYEKYFEYQILTYLTMRTHKYSFGAIGVLVVVVGFSFTLSPFLWRLPFLVWIMLIVIHFILMHFSALFLKGILTIC